MGNICKRSNKSGPDLRKVVPNHTSPVQSTKKKSHPNWAYASNRITTTKYSILTFIPKNLFEQFHRFANLYFIFIVALNWVPQIQAYGKEIAMVPVIFVLLVTALKDAYEDFRRYTSDKKINHKSCRMFSTKEGQFKHADWKDIHPGDFIHLSCNEEVPADILLLRSSDSQSICNIETSSLDGETNLKQRQCVQGINYGPQGITAFTYEVICDLPNAEIYNFRGYIQLSQDENDRVSLNKDNIIQRGCFIRNTDWIEGFVVYAGHETKALMNNKNPRSKRSKLERFINRDVIWCVIILLLLCLSCAIGAAFWLGKYSGNIMFIPYETSIQFNPLFQGFILFFTYMIIFQAVIPLPLYVSIEIVKLLQVYFINNDLDLYYEPTDKRIECRALNVTEDLGQIEYVFSDKTGTLTENVMEFKTCTVFGQNYPHCSGFQQSSQNEEEDEISIAGSKYSQANVSRNSSIFENLKLESELQRELSFMTLRSIGSLDLGLPHNGSNTKQIQEFFLLMAICNTVVVSTHIRKDNMDSEGHVRESSSNNTLTNPRQPEKPLDIFSRLPEMQSKKLAPLPPEYRARMIPGRSQSITSLESTGPIFQIATSRLDTISDHGSVTSTTTGSSMRSDISNIRYEAESPDELALVKAASTYGCCLLKRTAGSVTVELPAEGEVELKVLQVLQFDSTRKRMSILVRHPLNDEIILYTKGADSAILSVLHKKYKLDEELKKVVQQTEKYITSYAIQGLRTLCMGKKTLRKEEYNLWNKGYKNAETAMEGREEKMLQCICDLEKDLDLLGATGIEDKLQDSVPETIFNLRRAGIKVWVLTGDKQETAIEVAHASKLFDESLEMIVINTNNLEETKDLIEHHLQGIERDKPQALKNQSAMPRKSAAAEKKNEYAMVIDGVSLAFALTETLKKNFLKLGEQCKSVICCRVTPIQKGNVVQLVRDELHQLTLAIGDGANDVSMIQTADIGIGISGQEGMQAVMASDFAIARFKFLQKLLLVHGHWSYDRLAIFAIFMFYKSLVSTFVLYWFGFYSGFSGSTNIDSLYLLLQHVAFHAFPPILNGIFDKDLSASTLMTNPELYKVGPANKIYTRLSFFVIALDSLYQSVIIHFACYFAYDESVGIWEYGTTMMVILVLDILLHLAMETHCWIWPQWLTLALSFLVFWLFGIIMNSFFFTWDHPVTPYWVMQNTIAKPIHSIVVVITCVAALLPRLVIRTIQRAVFPNVIMKAQIKEKLENRLTENQELSRDNSPSSESSTPEDTMASTVSVTTTSTQVVSSQVSVNKPVIVPPIRFSHGTPRRRNGSNRDSAESYT
ncbi:hypothetical protein CHS0354_000095 [Potamilus streckersoni]|uniref:Phospholipid-transporting ATPase n=1 Tax=Potamilus streckersoni TaxID=2493646 RepID=A0AAE0TJG5_9BIVA|nr:hypothetical protein CHS0354_000095 [Potamilus streckersoni]